MAIVLPSEMGMDMAMTTLSNPPLPQNSRAIANEVTMTTLFHLPRTMGMTMTTLIHSSGGSGQRLPRQLPLPKNQTSEANFSEATLFMEMGWG